MDDYDRGIKVLKAFYDEGIKYNMSLRSLSFMGFIKYVNQKSKSFIAGLGLGVSFLGSDSSRVYDSMRTLAKKSQGKIPNKLSIFTQAVIDGQTNFNFADFIEVSKMTAADLADYAEETGKNIKTGIGGLSGLTKYAKYLVPAGIILYFTVTLGGQKMIKNMVKK